MLKKCKHRKIFMFGHFSTLGMKGLNEFVFAPSSKNTLTYLVPMLPFISMLSSILQSFSVPPENIRKP